MTVNSVLTGSDIAFVPLALCVPNAPTPATLNSHSRWWGRPRATWVPRRCGLRRAGAPQTQLPQTTAPFQTPKGRRNLELYERQRRLYDDRSSVRSWTYPHQSYLRKRDGVWALGRIWQREHPHRIVSNHIASEKLVEWPLTLPGARHLSGRDPSRTR